MSGVPAPEIPDIPGFEIMSPEFRMQRPQRGPKKGSKKDPKWSP